MFFLAQMWVEYLRIERFKVNNGWINEGSLVEELMLQFPSI